MTEGKKKDDQPLVLVVDDDILMRLSNAKILEEIADVVMAKNTYEAEEIMRVKHPALVLLDDIMPNCPTGLSFLEKVKQDEDLADIPIIMVTASNKDKEIARGLSAGASAYITKPVDMIALKKAVIDVLHNRPKKVLMMIDQDDFADELEEIFLFLKCEVQFIDDMQGLSFVEEAPDLIVVDSGAPFLQLRNQDGWGGVPMVVLGMNREEGDLNTAGPISFLQGPFTSQDVAREAGLLLRGR